MTAPTVDAGAPPRAARRVVTIGGGHGQAAVLAGIAQLDCEITAIVSVADDGGCSGRLRHDFGIPPPGDLRRCLSTLALDRALADRFEERLPGPAGHGRSVGNMMLLEAYERLGSLQAAADWAAELLACLGRVVPAAEQPGRLTIYDRSAGVLQGETTVAARGAAAMVVGVHGVTGANPVAVEAIRDADVIVIGPGSFITSVLAAVMTGDIAEALVSTAATRLLMHNLVPERGQTEGLTLGDHVRLLRDHLCIQSGQLDVPLEVMRHGEHVGRQYGPPGVIVYDDPLADAADHARHAPHLVAAAMIRRHGFAPRRALPPSTLRAWAWRRFDEHLSRALARVR